MSTNSPLRSNSSIQALMESASYPTTPVFDTDSNPSDDSYDEPPPHNQRINQDNLASFNNAKIRVISGKYKGLTGKIGKAVNNGWLYVDNNPKIDRPIRWGDVEVLKLAKGICSHSERNLMGARIRINDGRHCGLEGVIVEKRVGLSLKLDSLNGILLPLEDVNIIKVGRRANSASHDPHTKYMAAVVEVTGGQHLGMRGKVKRVFQDVHYVTDNVAIEKAYERKQFDVLSYADDDQCGGREGDDADDRNNGEDDTHLKDENDGDGNGKRFDPNYNPFIGLLVCVESKPHKGHVGRVLETHSRGWWKLDNLSRMVKSSQVKIVDDGRNIDIEAIREYYSQPGRLTQRMPPVVKLSREMDGNWNYAKEEVGNVEEETGDAYETRSPRSRNSHLKKRRGDHDDFEDKPSETDVLHSHEKEENSDFVADQVMSEKESSIRWGRKPASHPAISNVPELNKKQSHRRYVRGSSVPVLDPILVQTSESYLGDVKSHTVMLQLIPEEIRHLPPDTKIEIFNRRTGIILRGEEAISLSDLPSALMDHSEYEPIVPPAAETKISSRIGRSGRIKRVNKTVVEQCRLRGSAVEGNHVLVTGGEYRGLTGVVDSCIPGGWYVISKLFKHDKLDLDVIVSSTNLEVIPERVRWSQPPSSRDDITKKRIHFKATKLRVDALEEEREISLSSTSENLYEDPKILKLNSDIRKLIEDIQLQQAYL